MFKLYMKQAWYMIKANPLVSTVSIIGTALSIAMIMVVIMVWQIQIAGYAPEYNRERMLYINGNRVVSKNSNNGTRLSSQAVKEVFYSMELPEAVTAYTEDRRPVSLPGKRLYKGYTIKYTDPGFWKVFNFDFKTGQPFTDADFLSGIPKAVVSDKLAKELFGSEDVIGETILLDYDPFTIAGVVEAVSRAALDAYGDVWVPYTRNADYMNIQFLEGISGPFSVALLARTKKDFSKVIEEINRQTNKYNESKSEFNLVFPEEPLDRLDKAVGSTTFRKKDVQKIFTQVFGLLLFLLIVPALNLTGVNQAFFQQRKSEIGLRKSFGATFGVLVWQILTENMLTTLIGGLIGFMLSFVFLLWGKRFLLHGDPILNGEMLFQPGLFLLALFFLLALNISSALIPAWKLSRQPVVEALNENN